MKYAYQYTLLGQDGTKTDLGTGKKKDFRELYQILNCDTLGLIPTTYYPKEYSRATIFGDDEARFNTDNHRNPFTKVLTGDIFDPAMEWDCVGNLVVQQRVKVEA